MTAKQDILTNGSLKGLELCQSKARRKRDLCKVWLWLSCIGGRHFDPGATCCILKGLITDALESASHNSTAAHRRILNIAPGIKARSLTDKFILKDIETLLRCNQIIIKTLYLFILYQERLTPHKSVSWGMSSNKVTSRSDRQWKHAR